MFDPEQELANQIDQLGLYKQVKEELLRGFNAERNLAKIEAIRHGQFNQRNEARSVEGIGQKIGTIPPTAFHYWGQRLGYECWEDKQFVLEFLRDNPETAVNNYCKRSVVQGAVFTADGRILT